MRVHFPIRLSRWRRFAGDTRAAAALEFALVVVPFLIFLFGIFQVGLLFFINAGFDASVQRSARLIRTGQAQTTSMTLAQFRTNVCAGLANLFDCYNQTYFSVSVITNLNSATYTSPVNSSGAFNNTQTFTPGSSSDFIVVRGYMKYAPMFNVFGMLHASLADGTYLFGSTALFRNEPF